MLLGFISPKKPFQKPTEVGRTWHSHAFPIIFTWWRYTYATEVRLRDGRRIFYKSCGQGMPVIAFHGMCSSHKTWDQASPHPGVRLIAMDRPGYGESSAPPRDYSYTQFVHDLEAIKG